MMKSLKKYEADSERDAHIGRHMNLFASGFYEPPLALSLPVAIEKIKFETSNELQLLKKGQAQCRFVSPGSKTFTHFFSIGFLIIFVGKQNVHECV